MKYNELLKTSQILNLLVKHLNLSLQRKGKSFVSLCPFHEDKNPSLSFEPNWKIFRCFSCNFSAGNIFEFWAKCKKGNREITSAELRQSLEEISKLGYFSLPTWQEKEEKKDEEKIVNLISFLSDVYRHNLFTSLGREILNYLQTKRQLNKSLINRFSLGCSISNKQITNLFLQEKVKNSFSSDDLLFTNLVKINDNNQIYDYFSARQLILPLKNERGKIVAFAARKMEVGLGENKYNYLPTYQSYHKSFLLYNYLPVQQNRVDECYLVEGFFDVISLTRVGVENCLGLLGTNLSLTQTKLLRQLKKRIIIFLDGDKAGREATINITINLLLHEIDCEVIKYDYQGDPDDICGQHDQTTIHHILHQRKNPYLFILDYCYEKWEVKDNPQRIARFIEEIVKFFSKFKENIHYFLIEKISALVKWNRNEVEKYFINHPYPILHINNYCQKIIQEKEEKIIALCVQKRKFWLITSQNNYFFWNKNNRKYYQDIYNYYISSPYYKFFPTKHYKFVVAENLTSLFSEITVIKQYIRQINNYYEQN